MASASFILYTPASSMLSNPTMTFASVGNSIPHNARSRSPGDSLDAHPEPFTVVVRRTIFSFVMFAPFQKALNGTGFLRYDRMNPPAQAICARFHLK
jgi:hypothetical protein